MSENLRGDFLTHTVRAVQIDVYFTYFTVGLNEFNEALSKIFCSTFYFCMEHENYLYVETLN